jgi:glycosyltransferase involved in cell wall biosynthesis
VGRGLRLLLFNLKTDADDDVLGFTTDWINALARRCERISVITMAAGRLAVAGNVEVHSVGKERGWSEPRRAAEFYRLLAAALRGGRIDACFAHMMPLFAVMAWPLLAPRRIRTVLWYAHGHVPPMLRIATRLVDRVVSSSASGFRLQTPKLRIVGQGIDTERFRPANEPRRDGSLVLLTVGRIAPVKHLEATLEAIALLPERLADGRVVRARFVGNPATGRDLAYQRRVEERAAKLGLAARVEFLPARPFAEIDRIYREADVFVNSSQTGSLDKAVLEAMASGLPVVTTNPAFAEESRCFVKDDLAGALQSLLKKSDDERRALGLELRRTVEREHSLERLCDRLMEELKPA